MQLHTKLLQFRFLSQIYACVSFALWTRDEKWNSKSAPITPPNGRLPCANHKQHMPGTAVLRTSVYLRTPSKKGKYDRKQTPNDHITLEGLILCMYQKIKVVIGSEITNSWFLVANNSKSKQIRRPKDRVIIIDFQIGGKIRIVSVPDCLFKKKDKEPWVLYLPLGLVVSRLHARRPLSQVII